MSSTNLPAGDASRPEPAREAFTLCPGLAAEGSAASFLASAAAAAAAAASGCPVLLAAAAAAGLS